MIMLRSSPSADSSSQRTLITPYGSRGGTPEEEEELALLQHLEYQQRRGSSPHQDNHPQVEQAPAPAPTPAWNQPDSSPSVKNGPSANAWESSFDGGHAAPWDKSAAQSQLPFPRWPGGEMPLARNELSVQVGDDVPPKSSSGSSMRPGTDFPVAAQTPDTTAQTQGAQAQPAAKSMGGTDQSGNVQSTALHGPAPVEPRPVAHPQAHSGAVMSSPTSDTNGATQLLADALNPPSQGYSNGAKVLFRMADLVPRVAGGIMAGSNKQVQHQYQKHPFQPFNWMFGYDDPPSEQEAMQWTTAQIALNDALEAGLVERNSPSLRPNEPITIKTPAVKGDGKLGPVLVQEPVPGQTSAGRYQAEIPSVSHGSDKIWVPALGFANSNGKGFKFVKFDGIDVYKKTVVDRKFNVTGHRKQADDVKRQVEAMIQNPDWTLVLEVPSVAVGEAVTRLYAKAINEAMPSDGPLRPMPQVTLDVVRPGSTNTQKYDALPVSELEVEAPRSSIRLPPARLPFRR